MLDSWAAVELWIIEFLAVSVLWVLDVLAVSVGCSFLGCFLGPWMDAKHDKRMALMGHSLRAHAVLMLTVNTCFWRSGSQTDGTHVGLVRHSC